MHVLVTGASGYIGQQIVKKLLAEDKEVIGIDLNEASLSHQNYKFFRFDIRDKKIEDIFKKYSIDSVIHLACVVTPGPNMTRELMYEIDVDGTQNILNLVKNYKVKTLSLASSGAAYGYHADNSEWLKETDQLRGNEEFPYSYHKKIVEIKLQDFKEENKEIRLFIFRIGTVLGKTVNNQITDLFKKPFLIGIRKSLSPFVFIWDEDLVEIFIKSLELKVTPGIYNVAGSGKVSIQEIGEELQKKVIFFPALFLKTLLYILKRLKFSQYGEEQINFLRYRPVLCNEKLIKEFGYKPSYTSKEALRKFIGFQKDHL